MAEHGTPDLISSQAPFIQALVQKSVTAITKLAGRLSFRMLRDTRQGADHKKLEPRVLDGQLHHRDQRNKSKFKSKNAE